MKLKSTPSGYILSLTGQDITDWANKPGQSWPCSTLAGHSIEIEVDAGGLCDYYGPAMPDNHELAAIVTDHLLPQYRHLWPTWDNVTPKPIGMSRRSLA